VGRSETMELVDIYADRGITGTSLTKREHFTRMLADAGLIETKVTKSRSVFEIDQSVQPKFDVILVKNTSRFARNVMVIDILRELLKNKVYVKFLDIDLLFDSSDKEFMLNLFLNFDQQDSIDKSKKVRFGLRESAQRGRIFGASNLFGYDYHPKSNSLTVNEKEAKIVLEIFNLYSKGLGVRRIINVLNDKKYYTRKDKEFSPSMIKRMISNEKYMGTLARNKYDSGVVFNKKTYSTIKPKEEWIVTEDRIPPIVSKELFLTVQNIKISKVNHIIQKGIYKGITEYAGLIYCEKCGSVYTSNIDKGRRYYNCKTKKTKGRDFCDNPNVNYSEIDYYLQALQCGGYYEMFVKDKETRVSSLKKQRDLLVESIDKQDIDKSKDLNSTLSSLEIKKKKLLELYLDGVFEKETLDIESEKIEKEIVNTKKEIKNYSQSNENIMEQVEQIEEKIVKINEQEIKKLYEKEEVLNMIDKLIVRTGEKNQPIVDVRFDGDSSYSLENTGEKIEFDIRKYI